MVLRTKSADTFALIGADARRIDIPRAAVTGFTATASGGAGRMAELTLDRAKLGEELLGRLGGLEIAIEKAPPIDTLKELPGDGTIKESSWDTPKKVGVGDTLKEQPFDTLKEVAEGTGTADTFVEGLGQPGGELTNPALQMQSRGDVRL